jgi:protein TonB
LIRRSRRLGIAIQSASVHGDLRRQRINLLWSSRPNADSVLFYFYDRVFVLTAIFQSQGAADHRRRTKRHPGAFILALILHLLVLGFLLWQRGAPVPIKEERALSGFTLSPDAKDETGKEKTDTKESKSEAAQGFDQTAKTPPPPTPVPPRETEPVPSKNPLPFIEMSGSDFASSDIAGIPSGKKGTQASGDSKAAYGPGEGPGGATLYDADWYRPPTNAELNGYLRPNAPRTGWGLIACKTIEHYHVDDCVTLGEAPLGSGFARSVRDAAWQFLVLPPRINGKPVMGAWVRIRISYNESGISN